MQHLRATGHRLCRCGGYYYEHRPGSPLCEPNPMSAGLLASRYGASDKEVLDIALEIVLTTPGRAVADCPF